jgi:hypothetical protein
VNERLNRMIAEFESEPTDLDSTKWPHEVDEVRKGLECAIYSLKSGCLLKINIGSLVN